MFGSESYLSISKEKIKTRCDEKKCIFMEYSVGNKRFKVSDPKMKPANESRDISFYKGLENKLSRLIEEKSTDKSKAISIFEIGESSKTSEQCQGESEGKIAKTEEAFSYDEIMATPVLGRLTRE